jgi:hypothetical protein
MFYHYLVYGKGFRMFAHLAKRSFLFVALAATAIALAAGSPLRADSVSYSIDTPNSAISGFPGPYATVTVNLTSPTTATLTYTSLVAGGNINLFGDGGSVAANVNAASFTVGSITGTNAGTGFTPGPYSLSSGNEDGFGNFNLQVDSFDGFTNSADTISFTLTNNTGTWATAADVLTPNGSNGPTGGAVGMHAFITPFPANSANGAIVTGFATNSGGPTPIVGPTVPAPPSVVLLSAGVLLLGGVGWSRRRALRTAA